jgi:hypothetical protein
MATGQPGGLDRERPFDDPLGRPPPVPVRVLRGLRRSDGPVRGHTPVGALRCRPGDGLPARRVLGPEFPRVLLRRGRAVQLDKRVLHRSRASVDGSGDALLRPIRDRVAPGRPRPSGLLPRGGGGAVAVRTGYHRLRGRLPDVRGPRTGDGRRAHADAAGRGWIPRLSTPRDAGALSGRRSRGRPALGTGHRPTARARRRRRRVTSR